MYRLVPKDGSDFEVVADASQLKPKEDKVESTTNGINYFPACGSFFLDKSCYYCCITNFYIHRL
jgi:hypothetical protein